MKNYTDFLKQWWILKDVQRKPETRQRNERIYHSHPYCFGLHLIYWPDSQFTLSFSFFIINDGLVEERGWRTSLIESIEENDEEVIFITKNTKYTFKRLERNPLIEYTIMN